MLSYPATLLQSWVHGEASARSLAALLGLTAPISLRALLARCRAVETLTAEHDIHTSDSARLNGHVRFDLQRWRVLLFSATCG